MDKPSKNLLMTEEFKKFKETYSDIIEAHRRYSETLYQQGNFDLSISHLLTAIKLEEEINHRKLFDDYNRAAANFYAMGNFPAATDLMQVALSLQPDNKSLLNNYAALLQRVNRYTEAEKILQKSLSLSPNQVIPLDALAYNYFAQGKIEDSIKIGNQSLALKDQQSTADKEIAALQKLIKQFPAFLEKPKPFNPDHPEKNVIAFSLWGDKKRYLSGAIANAMLTPIIYPGWSCRFYCQQDVPKKAIEKLKSLNATVIELPQPERAYYGLFWRFLVANDPKVERFLVRDCDSLINTQERVAVDEWLCSDKYFHIMRDFYSHTELIHAGMWGGVAGVLPSLKPLINHFMKNNYSERTIDQLFLRQYVWPCIKLSHLAHDSLFSFGNWKRFPFVGKYPNQLTRHVGQDFSAVHELAFLRYFFSDL